ncbi:MAG: PspC domain-containing protein [Acidimicrobiales bacterium]
MSDVPNENENPAETESETGSKPGTTTLHRSRTTKVFGGVAGGIGERFDVDANIVRVVFVVLALVYGLGIAIYLALWALVPRAPSDGGEENRENEVASQHRSRWLRYAVLIGVVALFIIFLANLPGHHVTFLTSAHGNHVFGPRFGEGVAILWLVFLAILAVIAVRTSKGFTLGRFLALGLFSAITFLILTVGAFFILLQVLGVPIEGGSGTKSWNPTSVAQVQRNYHGAYGSTTIDLSGVPFTSGTWSITATQGVGVLTVDVPMDAVVALRTHVGVGNVNTGGLNEPPRVPSKNAPHLELNVQVGIGELVVQRTPS